MTNVIHWPHSLFASQGKPSFQKRPFSRSGGMTLGGRELVTQTDLGFWRARIPNIVLRRRDLRHEEAWNAIEVALHGQVGLVIVSVSHVGSQVQKLAKQARSYVPHADETGFSDDTFYASEPALVQLEEQATLGSTVLKLRGLQSGLRLSGIHFSYLHALYNTGPIIETVGDVVRVPIFPAIRAPIPAGTLLNVTEPSCLMKLASDNEMNLDFSSSSFTRKTVNFVEAIDYWDKVSAP
ncbi:hypothetical protein [Pseudovibrio sp. POLY-S9]|uniref:hypothetical protein n=1 Tax=Pseudovibrio sp. POLY-S9 TaxID=1576596 RepID=UPI000B33CEE4|nr:hypothetical protein [Pseudovibrio sp. POLY-S9]